MLQEGKADSEVLCSKNIAREDQVTGSAGRTRLISRGLEADSKFG